MEGVGATSSSSYRNWVKVWLFEPHTHGVFYFVHYNCTVLCCNLIIGWLVQNQGDNTERTRLDYQRNHKIWLAWTRWSRSVIKYTLNLQFRRYSSRGFTCIFMISRGKYDKECKILWFKHSRLWFELSKFCRDFCLQVFNFVIFQSWKM